MSATPSFHHAVGAPQLAQDLARFVAQALRGALARRNQALLVVSGGSTPVPFFEALAREGLYWPAVNVTLADERWLPPGHSDSNERLVRTHLLQGLAAQARFLPMFDARFDDPGLACPGIEASLAALPWPADVVVLGMGSDGHTASLFPNAPELDAALKDDGPRCMPVQAPRLPNVPVPRLTLTRRALLDARQLVIHVTGESKSRLVQRALAVEGPLNEAVRSWPIRLALCQDKVPCAVFHAP
jgi:6-phosphogluconolactonase